MTQLTQSNSLFLKITLDTQWMMDDVGRGTGRLLPGPIGARGGEEGMDVREIQKQKQIGCASQAPVWGDPVGGGANNTVGTKAQSSHPNTPELHQCPSPLAGCTHQGNRLSQGLQWQFSCPHGCWPHRWGWHWAGSGTSSHAGSRSWGLVLVSHSTPAPWEDPCSPRSPPDPLCSLGPCTPEWHCTSLVWWMVTWPGSQEEAWALG